VTVTVTVTVTVPVNYYNQERIKHEN